MRDGPGLRVVKRLALSTFLLSLGLHRGLRRWRGERPSVLQGDCGRCGSCCERPALRTSRVVSGLPVLKALFLWWHRRVNGFELVQEERGVFHFACTHFDLETRSCDSYDSRPGPCHDYPRLQLWQAQPEFLPRCGLRSRPANREGLIREIRRQGMTSEREDRLRRDLGLD